MRKALLSMATAALLTMGAAIGHSQDASDDVVCRDIGGFKTYNCVCRGDMGVLQTADHFGGDHKDISCEVTYHSVSQKMTVKAEVTRHNDFPDAVTWLVHEVDKEFRTYYGAPEPGYVIRNMDSHTLYALGSKGWDYRWISGNKVVMVRYFDTAMKKPEPLEIVKAYLAKNPSTLSAATTTDLRSPAHAAKWIKDEMERRLWLCERWFRYSAFDKAGKKQVPELPVESLKVFLDYREQYFGVAAAGDKNELIGYLSSKNDAGIKAKLAEYKTWWAANKDKELRM